jgi:hypothetical protein
VEINIPQLIYLNCSGRLNPLIDIIATSLFALSTNWLLTISYLQQALN